MIPLVRLTSCSPQQAASMDLFCQRGNDIKDEVHFHLQSGPKVLIHYYQIQGIFFTDLIILIHIPFTTDILFGMLIIRLVYICLLVTACYLHSHPDHYSTSSKCSGVDMNTARLLFHRVVQQDHPEVTQQVSGHKEMLSLVNHIHVIYNLFIAKMSWTCIDISHVLH